MSSCRVRKSSKSCQPKTIPAIWGWLCMPSVATNSPTTRGRTRCGRGAGVDLRNLGAQASYVRNGPCVSLLDPKLRKVDGLEVLRRVKGDPRTKNFPVVVLTSSREERDIVESYALGSIATLPNRWTSTSSPKPCARWDSTGCCSTSSPPTEASRGEACPLTGRLAPVSWEPSTEVRWLLAKSDAKKSDRGGRTWASR